MTYTVLGSPWMALAAGSIIMGYCVGAELTFGILTVDIMEELDVREKSVTWIGSIHATTISCIGKVMGYIHAPSAV